MKKTEQQVVLLARSIMYVAVFVSVAIACVPQWSMQFITDSVRTATPIVFCTGILFWFFVIKARKGLAIYGSNELWVLIILWGIITYVSAIGVFLFSLGAPKIDARMLMVLITPTPVLSMLWYFSIVHNIPACTIQMNEYESTT